MARVLIAAIGALGVASTLAVPTAGADSLAPAAKLTASDGVSGQFFGDLRSTAVSGDGSVVAVGDPAADGSRGAVYLFTRPSDGWTNSTQVAELTASDAATNDRLGFSVAISADGSTVVAGAASATRQGNQSQGAAYVFVRSPSGWQSTTESAKLVGATSGPDENFGWAVGTSADGSVVAASAPDVSPSGAGYVFARPGTGWTGVVGPTAALTAADGGFVGASLAVSEDGFRVLLGASDTTVGSNVGQGAAYVFSESALAGQQPPDWSRTPSRAKLTASDGRADDALGVSVAFSGGSTAVAESNSGAYVFQQPGPLGWSDAHQVAKLTASNGARLGAPAISADGTAILIGAPIERVGANTEQGVIYGFKRTGSSWSNATETSRIVAANGAADDFLGRAVAISSDGSTIVGGAPGADIGANVHQGAAYVLRSPTSAAASCQPAQDVVGQPTTCQVTVADTLDGPTPTGRVNLISDSAGTFAGQGSCSLTEAAPGTASCSLSYTPSVVASGTHTISATYSGDVGHASSSGADALTVTRSSSSTVLRCSSSAVTAGWRRTCTVRVSGGPVPTGKVAFRSDAGGSFASGGMCTLSAAAASGTASCQLTYTPRAVGSGTHKITASYPGDANHTGSRSTASLPVTAATTSTTLRCAPLSLGAGQRTACRATVADTASGRLTPRGRVRFTTHSPGAFDQGSCTLSPTKSTGVASCRVHYIPSRAGSRDETIRARYGGDTGHAASTGTALIELR